MHLTLLIVHICSFVSHGFSPQADHRDLTRIVAEAGRTVESQVGPGMQLVSHQEHKPKKIPRFLFAGKTGFYSFSNCHIRTRKKCLLEKCAFRNKVGNFFKKNVESHNLQQVFSYVCWQRNQIFSSVSASPSPSATTTATLPWARRTGCRRPS